MNDNEKIVWDDSWPWKEVTFWKGDGNLRLSIDSHKKVYEIKVNGKTGELSDLTEIDCDLKKLMGG